MKMTNSKSYKIGEKNRELNVTCDRRQEENA